MEYFGASDAWYAQTVGGWSDATRSQIADLLFSQTSGIGLSCWRFNIGGGIDPTITIPQRTVDTFEVSQGVYDWTRCPNERWFLGAAKARGVPQFLMFSNSPTRRMTKNGHTYCDPSVGTTNLKTGYEGQFATYLVDVAKHFRDNPDPTQRINFNYISPVNEPEWDWNGTTQEGSRWSTTDIKNVVNALYTELQNQGVNSQIMITEAGQIQDMYSGPDYVDAFAGDPSVNTKLGNRLTYHSYWSDDPNGTLVSTRAQFAAKMAQYPGWKPGESEYSILGSNGPGRDLTMTTALNVARVIHYDLTVANSTAWTWWLAMSAADWKDGLIYLDMTNQTFQTSKTLWALGNYSRFIRPGAQRVAFSGDNSNVNGLLASAYKNTATGDFDIVYINEQSTSQAVQPSMTNVGAGMKSDYLTPYVTSDTPGDDLKQYTSFLVGDSYTVPARAVVTLAAGTLNENNDGKILSALVGSKNYVLGGGMVTFNPGAGTYSGSLSGSGGFIKAGAGIMVLGGNSTYLGQTQVNGGMLKLNSATALGSTAGGTVVSAGGTVDVNGFVTGDETFAISGSGAGGQGALVNNGANIFNDGVHVLNLNGNVTIGGMGRWNVRAPNGATTYVTGNGGDVTKVGTNDIWFTGSVISGIANININAGQLGFEDVTGGMGDASGTVTVASSATLGFYTTNPNQPAYMKNVVLNGGTIANWANTTKLTGPITLSGTNTINSGPQQLILNSAVTGSGSLTKTGSGSLVIRQAGNWSGATNVSAGTVEFDASESMGALALAAGTKAVMGAGTNGVLRVGSLSVDSTATLDLNDNDLVVNGTAFSTIQALVFSGYRQSSDPSATGIISSTGQTSAGNPVLALFDNALVHATDYPFGSGQTISPNAVVGMYTYLGDTNGDGMVTPDDYSALDANLGATNIPLGLAWFVGDTNYDGRATPDDYGALDANLGLGVGNPLSANGLAVVPEPMSGAAALMLLGAWGLRRRRHSV